jgi:hypothetical protein
VKGKTLFFFALFWSAITLTFDGFIGQSFWNQHRSATFAQTVGMVVSSRIQENSDSDSTTYRPEVHYTYQVNGETLTGTKVRFQSWSSSDHGYARKITRDYPVGSSVTVYYNPIRPEEAVLETQVGGPEYFLFLFLLPFNIIMVCLWYGNVAALFPAKTVPLSGYPIIESPGQISIRLSSFNAFALAGAVVFLLSFLSIFVVAFTIGMSLSLSGLIGWLIFFGTAAFCAFVWQQYRLDSGRCDFRIDRQTRMVDVPQTMQRAAHRIPLDAITEIDLVSKSSDNMVTYCPVLNWIDEFGARQESRLIEISDQDQAEALRRWLRQQLGLMPEKN